MMFRFVNRLKKKHGAVLFVVIAVMALLIAMSSAAYYTARGSYNTVASSYNYSQLYLSAISSADMVSAAIMNEPIPSAAGTITLPDGSTKIMNDFQKIKDKIQNDLNAVGNATYLKSNNLSSVTVNASTSPQDVIDALKNVPSVEPGVLDGLTVEIRVINVGGFNVATSNPTLNDSQTLKTDHQTGTTPFTYSITTTAYYRDNTITVQDIIKTDKAGTRTVTQDWNPPTPGGGGGSSLPSDFNPNIATGQQQGSGEWNNGDRTVTIDVKEINGDMAFRNDITEIGGKVNLGNTLNGGLTSEGSLYLRYGGPKVTGTDKNWYVGRDLVLADAQSNFDLGQNDLYVGGDFIIGTNGGEVKARDIYVNGDLYVLNQKTINAENLHVNGNIYYATYDANGNIRTRAYTRTNDVKEDNGSTDDANIRNRLQGNFNLSLHGHVITEGQTANGTVINKVDNINLGSKYRNLSNYSTHSDANGIQDFWVDGKPVTNADGTVQTKPVLDANGNQVIENGIPKTETVTEKVNTKHQYTVLTTNKDGDSYDKTPTTGSALDAIKANTNQDNWEKDDKGEYPDSPKSVYPNYTAGQKAYDTEATIDFSALVQIKDANGQVTGYEGRFPIGDTGEEIVVTVEGGDLQNAQDIQIDIPYVKDGFLLNYAMDAPTTTWEGRGLDHDPWYEMIPKTTANLSGLYGNQSVLHYNIDTASDGSSMPIVLAANKGNGDFSWTGDSSQRGADVSVKGDGKVTFEMGNYNTETNKYEPFKVENANKYEIPTYIQGKTGSTSTVVGSEQQVSEIGGAKGFDHLSAEEAKSMSQKSNVMLVSNKSSKAFRAEGKNGVFCGYIYAPNGTLSADNDTNGSVINVGSIVISSYEATHAEYQVSLPTPSDMTDFIGALNGDTGVSWGAINGGGSTGGPSGPGNPGGPAGDPNPGPVTYTGFEGWQSVGSNYVGNPLIPSSGGSESN